MLLQIATWIGTLLLLAATVACHVVGCDKKEKSLAKKRQSLDVGVSDLDEVQPVKREVSRANEIRGGARGKKAEYKTLMQMEKSDFDKSMGTIGSSSETPSKNQQK